MEVCLVACGNYNVGDNALLHGWLSVLNHFLTPKDIVYVLGIEPAYIMQYSKKYNYRIIATNALYRYFFGCTDAISMEKKFNSVFEDPDYDCFTYELHQIQQIFARIDLLHIIGGGIVNCMWLDMQYLTMAAIELAKRNGVRIIMTGQTLGPFHEEDEKRLLPYFRKIDLLDLRDDCPWLKKEKIDYQITVDDALAYMVAEGDSFEVPEVFKRIEDKKFITVCLQSWNLSEKHRMDYAQMQNHLAQFLNNLLTKDSEMQVCFLEFMHLDHDQENNKHVFNQLSGDVKKRCHFITCSNYYPFAVASFVGKAEFCVTTRLHLSIFSMMSGISTYSLVLDEYYKKKLEGAYESFNVHQVYNLEECTKENLERSFEARKKVTLVHAAREAAHSKYQRVLDAYLQAATGKNLLMKIKMKRFLQKI